MNKIQEAIKCLMCDQQLETPILLPCGHAICKKHNINTPNVYCSECDKLFLSADFPQVHQLEDLIEKAKIASIDFGPQHQKAKHGCQMVRNCLNQISDFTNHTDAHIQQTISELRNRVLLKSEKFRNKIDNITEKLLSELKDYEANCLSNLNIFTTVCAKDRINLAKKPTETKLNSWLESLHKLKLDEQKWMKIEFESYQTVNEMNKQLEAYKDAVFMKSLAIKKSRIEYFEKIDIDLTIDLP